MKKLFKNKKATVFMIIGLLIIISLIVFLIVKTQTVNQSEPNQPKEPTIPVDREIPLDTSGASAPNLHSNMIPIRWSGENWVKADKDNFIEEHRWYDYNKQIWANAVTVTSETREKYQEAELGTVIDMDDILTMMVWIPRYRYQLWNANNGSSNPQEINIVFEGSNTPPSCGGNECTPDRRYYTGTNGEWLTHPAFTFGELELEGFWVGKFESSSSNPSAVNGGGNVTTLDVRVLPNVPSWRDINVSNMFRVSQKMSQSENIYGYDETADVHMIKNIQWGAIAYLSHSKYGKWGNSITDNEVFINPSNRHITGRSGNSASQGATVDNINEASNNLWGYNGRSCNEKTGLVCTGERQETFGMAASTTGNIYGVYGMSGGSWEYVMGNIVTGGQTAPGPLTSNASGFVAPFPDSRYFDSYRFGTDCCNEASHERGVLGDATKETLRTFGTSRTGAWYGSNSNFPYNYGLWFGRSGNNDTRTITGIFHFSRNHGGAFDYISWRIVHL